MQFKPFFQRVAQAKIHDTPTLEKWMKSVPADVRKSSEQFIPWLVDRNFLTDYQVKMIFAGKGSSLKISHYMVLGKIARGGMGWVFKAKDLTRNRLCAIKILKPDRRDTKRAVLRFQREMEVSQKLQHPGIAIAYESGVWREMHFLAMEYVPGPTLFQLVRREGPLTAYHCAMWSSQLADALHFAHNSGVIHRDLKPSNVIITPENKIKLLDLGLARWLRDDHNERRLVGDNRVVGSFDYMAPEQGVNSSKADAKSDLYALGCLMYFALTGSPPFSYVEGSRAKLEHHLSVIPIPVGSIRKDLPKNYDSIVTRLMAKDPKYRYDNAAEVSDILRNWTNRLRSSTDLNNPSIGKTDDGSLSNRIEGESDPQPRRR